MKVLLIFVMWCGVAVGQLFGPPLAMLPPTTTGVPGVPTFLQVGSLSCAARMYTPTQLQVWCFKDVALKVIGINALSDVSDMGFELTVADSNNYDTNTSIVWLFLPTQLPPTPIVVAWQATITRATVVGNVLSGIL